MSVNVSVDVRELLEKKCCNNLAACTDEQLYYGLLGVVKDLAKEKESNQLYFSGIFDRKAVIQQFN